MKRVLVVDGNEIQQAVIAMLLKRPSLSDRHIAAVHLVCNTDEPRPELRIRCVAVHFDTEKAAREYVEPAKEEERKADENVTENVQGAAP